MDDLHHDSHAQTGLETKHFALCSEHFESSYFSRSVLIGIPVDFRRFYLEEDLVPSIYTKSKDSLDSVASCGATLSSKIHGFFLYVTHLLIFSKRVRGEMSFQRGATIIA